MESNKTEEELEKLNTEKVLPRGLEQISHLFLTHSTPNAGDLPVPLSVPLEEPTGPNEDSPLAVVSRRFMDRAQLLSLLGKEPAALEEGMRLIDKNIPYENSGSIELLALDCANQLSIIDLDISPNDALLLRGLSQLEWLIRNESIVSRMYREHPIDFSLQPRLILVAPDFSATFRSVVRLFKVPRIHCLKYHAFGMAGDAGIFFERVHA